MRQIIINSNTSETRIALLENDALVELHVERHKRQHIIGNVYLGRVSRVVAGMQSAFIDIGIGQAGFLYGKDVLTAESSSSDDQPYPENAQPIEKNIKEGELILVQVAKEAYGSKGARLTMGIAIPGRCLVLLPFSSHIGVSRKIEKDKERKRLRTIVEEIRSEDYGIIARTASEGAAKETLAQDFDYLRKIWQSVCDARKRKKKPTLLHRDHSIVARVARDMYSDDTDKIVVDSTKSFDELIAFFKHTDQDIHSKVVFHKEQQPIFDLYGIEQDIDCALQKRVELLSGGFVVIEETEALTTFDVNTGKFIGTGSANENIVKTNLEALQVIAAQIRLRNVAGLIVIDLIDMDELDNREHVYKEMLKCFERDKARTKVLRISDVGLVQMTRKRTRESLEKLLTTTCKACAGNGYVRDNTTLVYDLFRALQRTFHQTKAKNIKLNIREDLYHHIMTMEMDYVKQLKKTLGMQIEFVPTYFHDPCYYDRPFTIEPHD
ncbi:MAG: Rne/Rng family ribonuclease [Pseudomonadota bacterium]|nr:Rne/Rng family ribonuclease [Pseudomonadota bacterium]